VDLNFSINQLTKGLNTLTRLFGTDGSRLHHSVDAAFERKFVLSFNAGF